jgi:serine/threonine protein kinase/tetratricopeptide (TPR) repeat protein
MSEADAERRSTKARLFGEDASDHLRKQVAKARFMQALAQPTGGSETGDIREGATQPISFKPTLTVEPVHIGRYTVVRKLGEGGMGVVYAAYDEDLDRKVALKLLRGSLAKDERGRVRIRREAQALARLSHPNVVQVHEIGTWGEHDFVAMEFVAGKTLDRWLSSSAHTWPEILEVMLHAGRGLAAAHAAELVHRDFKPANILVGDDGRARVLDFGLARSADDTGGHPVAELLHTAENGEPDHDEISDADTRTGLSAESELDASADEPEQDPVSAAGHGTTHGDSRSGVFERELTATGAVLGTPVYMAPEQHLGQRATASSDQFSFCFVLYEALFGERPFRAETRDAYADRVIEGAFTVPSASSGVPLWLRKAVCRGLAPQPSDRWPSMDVLLDELSRDRESMWKRSVVAAGLMATLGVSLLLGASGREEVEQCSFDRAAVVDGWTDAERARVRDKFQASNHAFAERRLERTIHDLDTYADELVAAQTDACTQRWIDQVQTDAQLELRMACLEQRKDELRAAVGELVDGDATTVQRAPELLTGLGDIGMCARVELLERHTEVPKDEATAEAIAEVRESLVRGHTARRAGRLSAARDIANEAREQARQLDYAALTGEVAQLEGELAFQRRDYESANGKLLEALRMAESTGDPERRLDALLRLARVKTETGQSSEVELTMAEPLVERIGSPAPKRTLLYAVRGEALRRTSKANEALDEYNRAIDLAERGFVGSEHMLADLLVQRSMVLESIGRGDEGRADLDRALTLGLNPDDVNGLDALFNFGVHEIDAKNNDRAEQLLLQALEGYERVYGPRYPYIGHARLALARIALARGQDEEAELQVLRAREVLDAYRDERVYALDAHAALLLSRGRVEEAIGLLTRAVDGDVDDTAYLAYLRSRLGRALCDGRQYEQALVHLDQAIEALDGDPPQIDIVAPLTDRGTVWRNLGHLDRSLESLMRAVELTPITCDQPLLAAEARVELALTLDALGQHEEAREAAHAAYELLDKLPDERATLSPVESLLSPIE